MGAAFAAPVLRRFGIPLEVTHFFLMFPCMFASITPPVALGCVVAARLAGADYFKTAKATCRTAFIAFLLPFIVVYAPGIMLMRSPGEVLFWMEIVTGFLFVVTGQLAFIGYFLTNINLVERLILGLGALIFFLFLMGIIPIVGWIIAIISVVFFFCILHIPRYMAIKQKQPSCGL
jgi:TRAP-type uncharacterized transport system fused permease subunit